MSRYHPGLACIDCGHRCGHTVYRCRQCACREARHLQLIRTNRKENAMHNTATIDPTMGDIGEGQEEVELEPIEVPTTVPVEPVPA